MGWRRWIFGIEDGPRPPRPSRRLPRAAEPPPRPAAPRTPQEEVWQSVLDGLAQLTEAELGNRSYRVLRLLRDAERTRDGVYAAVYQVPEVAILFVDQSRLRALADEMLRYLDAVPAEIGR